jgi:hypothetical protein
VQEFAFPGRDEVTGVLLTVTEECMKVPATMLNAGSRCRDGDARRGCNKKDDPLAKAEKKMRPKARLPGIAEVKAIAEEAYIYGFPMIAAYKAMYEFNVDKSSPQYKAPFNEIWNDAKTFTPKDTAIVTPNADTPYSLVQADLRAEPIVLCVPKVDKGRYYSVMIADLYSFNYGYIGSRPGNGRLLPRAGPRWIGETPAGIEGPGRNHFSSSSIAQLLSSRHREREEDPGRLQGADAVAVLNKPAPPAVDADFEVHRGPFKTDFAYRLPASIRARSAPERRCAPSSPASESAQAKFDSGPVARAQGRGGSRSRKLRKSTKRPGDRQKLTAGGRLRQGSRLLQRRLAVRAAAAKAASTATTRPRRHTRSPARTPRASLSTGASTSTR